MKIGNCLFAKHISLLSFAALLSAVNVLLCNIPFFSFVLQHTTLTGASRWAFVFSLLLLMFVLNAFVCYLLLFLTRYVGRVLLAVAHLLSVACVYFVMTYHVIMDSSMLSNVFNTRYSEASGFITWQLVLWFIFFGILPLAYILFRKIDFGSWKRFGIVTASSLLLCGMLILANFGQFLWIGEYDTELGGLLMPWSYTVNTGRLMAQHANENREEILLPDASVNSSEKAVVVLVIGESARSADFSLYGYSRQTNPRLSARNDVYVFDAHSCATYTTAGVKAILEHANTNKLYEVLPNYAYRSGIDVIWRSANWGEPPLHIEEYMDDNQLHKMYPQADARYDELLFTGLRERINASSNDKVLVILHTSTSHGPCYVNKYPSCFEVFTPVISNTEEARSNLQALVNAYDNSILYTDYLLSDLIDTLSVIEDRKCAMIYVSDHGESLGENNLFMHGMPLSVAPREQYEIPFIMWLSDDYRQVKNIAETIDQHYVFHTVLNLLGMQSPVYDENRDLLKINM